MAAHTRWTGIPIRHAAGDVPPDLLGGETHDRCEPANQRLDHMVHRRLRRTPRDAVGPCGVLPVLDDIQIKTAHIHRTEVVHQLVDAMEFIIVIGLLHLSWSWRVRSTAQWSRPSIACGSSRSLAGSKPLRFASRNGPCRAGVYRRHRCVSGSRPRPTLAAVIGCSHPQTQDSARGCSPLSAGPPHRPGIWTSSGRRHRR